MPLMEWNNTLLLEVEPFDEHHEHLFCLLNRTYDLIVANASPDSFNELFKELRDYTMYHFSAEELWMHEQDYPLKEMHISQHKSFLEEVVRFEEEFAAKGEPVSLGVLTFIKEWLVHHIYKVDAEYALSIRLHKQYLPHFYSGKQDNGENIHKTMN